MRLINLLFVPEKSGLRLALWLSRWLVILAWFFAVVATAAVVKSVIDLTSMSGMALAIVGGQLLARAMGGIGLAMVLLIVSHLLVVVVISLRERLLLRN